MRSILVFTILTMLVTALYAGVMAYIAGPDGFDQGARVISFLGWLCLVPPSVGGLGAWINYEMTKEGY